MILNTIIYKYYPSDMRKTTKLPLEEQPLYRTLPHHARIYLSRLLAFAKRVKADTCISMEDELAVCMDFDVATFSSSLNWDLSQLICLSDDVLVMPKGKFAVEFSFLYSKI